MHVDSLASSPLPGNNQRHCHNTEKNDNEQVQRGSGCLVGLVMDPSGTVTRAPLSQTKNQDLPKILVCPGLVAVPLSQPECKKRELWLSSPLNGAPFFQP
eukprot:1140952-Pelagomonas_calceolata.AAC.7